MPLFSIITINYNNADGIERTIQSVVNQQYKNFEYIVIDGGSADSSCEIIREHEKSINYLSSEPDNGVYQAMNKGIRKATGKYCLFVNSGDILVDNNVLTDLFNETLKADIITGNALVGRIDKKLQLVKTPEQISFYTFFQHTILHQATLIRTSLFEEIGYYNENLKIVADWEFFIKALFLHHCSYQSVNVNISVFDNTGISSRPENLAIIRKERKEVLEKYFPHFLNDYSLFKPHSTFVFLMNIQKVPILRTIFTFTSRLVNKLFKFLYS